MSSHVTHSKIWKSKMNLTWATFNNIRMLLMACMPIVIFYLIWLVNTSEGIRSEEGTLLDLVCWPDGNAIPVIIACGSIIAVVIEVIRFSSKTVDLKANDTYLRSISYNSLTQLGTLWKLKILLYSIGLAIRIPANFKIRIMIPTMNGWFSLF